MEFNWAQALNVLDTAWKECDKEPKDENFDIKKNKKNKSQYDLKSS